MSKIKARLTACPKRGTSTNQRQGDFDSWMAQKVKSTHYANLNAMQIAQSKIV